MTGFMSNSVKYQPCRLILYIFIAAYVALEEQLETLGTRWASVCRWVEEQWTLLQEVLTRWQHFTEEDKSFSGWLAEKEELLARMRLVDLSDSKLVIEQVRNLKVSLVFVCVLRLISTFMGSKHHLNIYLMFVCVLRLISAFMGSKHH